MLKKVCYSLFLLLVGVIQGLHAQQITVDNTVSVQQLIENNLVQGCVETSNISSPINGSINGFSSYGYFERGNSNFPFENGIVITTGNANSAGNAINANVLNEGETSWGSDTDLENALGITNTLNATTIEFDFISISDQIQFNYILASEEYFANFPCDYSDGFAFLIRPAGSALPYTNIAVIPGTTIPVNTSTIHDEIVGFCGAENEQYFDGYNVGDTNYNGRTQVMTATATIVPNIQYNIKLIIADQTDENYDSAVFIEGNSFNATVDLGDDITTCADSLSLDGDIQNPQATYEWYRDNVLLNGETSPILDISDSGNYLVVVTIPLNGSTCVIQDSVMVTLSSEQAAGDITDYEICDDISNDGIEWFDLSTKTNEVIAAMPPSNYQVSYHLTLMSAQNNNSYILAPIQNTSNPQTIYVRIEDQDSGCLAYASFDLVVNPLPIINNPTPIEVCDDADNDGFTEIDLTQSNLEITGGNPNLQVSYHVSQADADTGNNPILSPYINSASTDNLFVRVVDINTGCVSTTTITVTVNNNPDLNSMNYTIDACDNDHDGFAGFDLTEAEAEILQGLTNVSVSYHTTLNDAQTGDNPIPDAESFSNTNPDFQVVFIRVVDNETGCVSIATINLHTNMLITATAINDYQVCDDDSNDGIESFDLNVIELEIINNVPDTNITFYLSQTDMDNQVNPIDESVPFINTTNPQTLYIELSNDSCTEAAEINLIINPPLLLTDIDPIDLCDVDDDGFTTIDLSTYDNIVTDNNTNYVVSYHGSFADADTDANPHPNFYTNVSNPETFYARVTNPATGCYDIVSMPLNIIPAPTASDPSDFIICDDDQDGFYRIDLETRIPEMVSSTNDLTIAFYTSLEDAQTATDMILDASDYNASTQTVYTRIESTLTTCFSIVPIDIIVNTVPLISSISDYQICQPEGDLEADFILNTKDSEILNGQTNMDVLYFESQNDADNRVNSIDKDNAYQNSTSPQTIFVRIENASDQNCYATTSFQIIVDPLPNFNLPLDWFVCDDISNDGVHLFDLNEKLLEITDGFGTSLTVNFYTSFENAEASANEIPLEYTNIQNPQPIYVRVENGSNCYTIAQFGLNVIQAPETNESVPLEVCDNDYDGISTFDLTISEFDILNIRQDDIVVTYFENETDLESQSNPIADPENYSNVDNPQTVYIRVTNIVSNCYVTIPLDLIVNLPPTINSVSEVTFCETDDSSISLEDITQEFIDDTSDVLVTYYDNAADADAGNNALTTEFIYSNSNTSLYIRVQYIETGCFITSSFNLHIDANPVANNPTNMGICDDDDDGIASFDLTTQTNNILNGQNPSVFTVTYYELLEDAQDDENRIDENYLAFNEQIIYARVENTATGCYSTTQFMTLVYPLPVIDIEDTVVICLDTLPLNVSAETGNIGDTYSWSTGETAADIDIDVVGNYAVTVTTSFGCQTTKNFEVIPSEPADIEVVEVIDFSDPNNVTITVSGIGNYAYILDDGEPQTSNVFEYVSLGYHTITIIDLNGCSEVTREIVVIDAPKFFTPNDDGYFDTWHITGVETLPGTTISIFDRYGKLLKFLTASSPGWNGFYNGKKMPSSDYWFLAKVQRGNMNFEVKGHFTLKR